MSSVSPASWRCSDPTIPCVKAQGFFLKDTAMFEDTMAKDQFTLMLDGLMASMNADRAKVAAQSSRLTLGGLIKTLQGYPDCASVVLSGGRGVPGTFMSYRGYYSDLALDAYPQGYVRCDVFLKQCTDALLTEFTGYKGGEFVMNKDTLLWVAEYGVASGVGIVGIEEDREGVGKIVLICEKVE